MKILITGASGLIGSALVESLHGAGHTLRCLQRNKGAGKDDSFWDVTPLSSSLLEEHPIDAVIHLAGENVASGRWSKARKRRIRESRVQGTRELIQHLVSLSVQPKVFLCASAIGYYGSRHSEILTESTDNGDGFLAEVCRQWESEANVIRERGIRVANLRFGMVLSPNGGALHKMLPPFKAGLGGPIGSGSQYMSWISIDDLVRSVNFILQTDAVHGPVNIVSPVPVTNKDFSTTLASVLHKPAMLPTPPFALRLLFGEMADEMLLASSRVKPEKLLQAGFAFQDVNLKETLEKCTTRIP